MNAWAQAGRLWRTVRWLRTEQVIGRVRFRLQRPQPDLRPSPPRRPPRGAWVRPPARPPSLVAATTMQFLGETHALDTVGWDDPALALLWRYNQHYFDDLNAQGADSRRPWHEALVERWIAENPPGRGTGWAPYPTSLRIVNWIKWFAAGAPCPDPWRDSLAVQARWLSRRLEWHLLGNHLFVNAKALVFAGLFFDGPEAEGWLRTGWQILERELPEQILADGGQFERSPMYHALALEDLLDLVNASAWLAAPDLAARVDAELGARVGAMADWLRHMTHPDGEWMRFNDCAADIAPSLAQLERYREDLGLGSPPVEAGDALRLLMPSGYVHVRRGDVVAVVDAAPVGPDYLPGHAHADTLSFELSVRGRELVVNRGTSVYGTGARRLLERGTAAHSTVQIGGHDSSEVWSGFRVGRRARPGPLHVDGWEIRASHDGYAHLPGRPEHHRRWRFETDGVAVEDTVSPASPEPTLARYHLAPGLELRPEGDGRWRIDEGAHTLAHVRVEHGQGQVERWQHAVGFGRLEPAFTLAVRLQGGRAVTRWIWAL